MGHVVSMVMVKTLCGISPANIGKLYAASVLGDSSSFVLVIQPGNGIRNRNSAW